MIVLKSIICSIFALAHWVWPNWMWPCCPRIYNCQDTITHPQPSRWPFGHCKFAEQIIVNWEHKFMFQPTFDLPRAWTIKTPTRLSTICVVYCLFFDGFAPGHRPLVLNVVFAQANMVAICLGWQIWVIYKQRMAGRRAD